MITLLYIILIYILIGAIVYQTSIQFIHKKISHFTQVLFWTLGILFAPVLKVIILIEVKRGFKQFDKGLKKIIRDNFTKKEMLASINNSDKSDEEKQKLIEYNKKIYK